LIACGSEEPSGNLVIEHQAHHRADVSDAAWTTGSAIVVSDAPSFPQPLFVRVRMVDDDGAELGIASAGAYEYLLGQVEPVYIADSCFRPHFDDAATYCVNDFDVVGPGGSVLFVTGRAVDRPLVKECFYYAVVDTSTDTDVLRRDLEARVDDCRANAR
jgi:hypothetical protein